MPVFSLGTQAALNRRRHPNLRAKQGLESALVTFHKRLIPGPWEDCLILCSGGTFRGPGWIAFLPKAER